VFTMDGLGYDSDCSISDFFISVIGFCASSSASTSASASTPASTPTLSSSIVGSRPRPRTETQTQEILEFYGVWIILYKFLKKKTKNKSDEAYASSFILSTPYPAGVYTGLAPTYTVFSVFFSLFPCALAVLLSVSISFQLLSILFMLCSPSLSLALLIFHLYIIYNHFRSRFIYTRFSFLDDYIHTSHSLSCRPTLVSSISFHTPFDHTRLPGQFYITILIHVFLDSCILQYTSRVFDNTGWICHCNGLNENIAWKELREWFSATG